MPDYVQTVLDFLDANWKATNHDPKPILIDKRDGTWQNATRRTTSVDLGTVGNNVASVGTTGGTSFEPEGLGWLTDRVESGVSVRIEGAHESEHGQIASASEFKSLKDEAIRALKVERKRPLPGYYRLEVRDVSDDSSSFTDYYRADIEAFFVGLEDLP